jgi:DNA modification methylase
MNIESTKLQDSTQPPLLQNGCYVQCLDNLELLKSQPNESVNMIYCDILYGTGRNFGDYKDLKPIRSEIESHYLPRLIEMKRVLKQNGSIYLQMDTRINHWMRILMDDVFGYDNFRNEIVWCYSTASTPRIKQFPRNHDVILWYSKSDNWVFNKDSIREPFKNGKPNGGNKWLKENETLEEWRKKQAEMGKIPFDWITDIYKIGTSTENAKYATQKPKELISRFVLASTNEGDVVADYYLGSGTTAKVCQELNRNFIGCDLNPKAIEITKCRLDGGQ